MICGSISFFILNSTSRQRSNSAARTGIQPTFISLARIGGFLGKPVFSLVSREGRPVAQQREGTTDRLVSIIASIKLEQRSGRLTVWRGEGLTVEEGTLIFVQGQVIQATVGRRSGPEAVNWLSTWRQASYAFLPAASEKATPPVSAFQPPGHSLNGTAPGVPAISSRMPGGSASPVSEVPFATVDLSIATANIDRAGLPRVYRRLYMLIDGRRSLSELVTLMGKSAEEVHTMLYNLEWLGVIRIAPAPQAEF